MGRHVFGFRRRRGPHPALRLGIVALLLVIAFALLTMFAHGDFLPHGARSLGRVAP